MYRKDYHGQPEVIPKDTVGTLGVYQKLDTTDDGMLQVYQQCPAPTSVWMYLWYTWPVRPDHQLEMMSLLAQGTEVPGVVFDSFSGKANTWYL